MPSATSKPVLKRDFANILGTREEHLKTVAEVFNPNRFGPETKKLNLIPGTAFDLQLGISLGLQCEEGSSTVFQHGPTGISYHITTLYNVLDPPEPQQEPPLDPRWYDTISESDT